MTSIFLGSLSSPLLPSISVQLIRCPPLHCLSIVVWLCLCFLFLRFLHVVHVWNSVNRLSFHGTCPNHRSLRWTTLSSRVVWLPKACRMSSLLILCSLVTPAILRSQLMPKDPFLNLFSHCPAFRPVQENRLYHRIF